MSDSRLNPERIRNPSDVVEVPYDLCCIMDRSVLKAMNT